MSEGGATRLERLNPSAKLVVLTVPSLALLTVFDPWTPGVLYLLAVTGVLAARALRPRALLLGQLPFAFFALGTLTVNALTRDGTTLWAAGPFTVTDEGLAVGAALALRTLLVGVCTLAFIATTDPADLLASLHAQLRLPARWCFALTAACRVLEELPEHWTTTLRAHAARRPADRRPDGEPRLRPALAWHATTSLLVVALRRGARLAIAMETRGLGDTVPRTMWRPPALHRRDVVFTVGCLAVVVAVLVGSACAGALAGPGRLLG